MRPRTLIFFVLCTCQTMLGQHLRVGVIAGVPLTRDYSLFATPGYTAQLPGGVVVTVPERSYGPGARSLVGGPMLGWDFRPRFALEGSAIYRRLRGEGSGPTVTWQFPVLLKYRFLDSNLSPFLEAGPSFRTTGNRNTNPSHFGVSAGAGLSFPAGAFRIAPGLRYTRWARDVSWTRPSRQDQIELLVSFSGSSGNNRRLFGRRVSAGLVAGAMLNPAVNWPRDEIAPPDSSVRTILTPLRPWVVGPHFEYEFRENWSLAGEATYRPLRNRFEIRGQIPQPDGGSVPVSSVLITTGAVLWQFPVLAKYRFPGSRIRPYLEGGPCFRLPQEYNGNLSAYGVTAGAGVDLTWRSLHFEPGLRFSHFGPARNRQNLVEPNYTRRNQLDALFVFRF